MHHISKMDERVTLQSRSTVTDAMGQEAITWVDVETIWAEVLAGAARGFEYFSAAQMQSEQIFTFRIRYREDVTTSWRLVWRTRNHDITAVLPVGRNDVLELMCTQGIRDGR